MKRSASSEVGRCYRQLMQQTDSHCILRFDDHITASWISVTDDEIKHLLGESSVPDL